MKSSDPYRLRIEKYNPGLGAYVDLTEEAPTGGLAWAVKSNIAVCGLPHTAGIAAYRNDRATRDAEVVRRIREQNGYILGTVNMHEGALGATTDNPAFGRTQNPWRAGFTPGGSSGGSGAAVAAGLCDVALGSDTMGSVRIPAAYCGVQGHKPTTGLVPNDGVLALSHSLDHVGPLARSVEMLWTAMRILTNLEGPEHLTPASFSGIRFGVWDGGGAVALSERVKDGFTAACARLSDAGAILSKPVSPPAYEYGRSRRAGLLVSEIEASAIHAERLATDPDGFSASFRKLMEWGAAQSETTKTAAYAHIETIRQEADRLFQEVDFVIAPTAPQQAFGFDQPVPANQADFTAWADFAALPATALYTGLDSDTELPLSLQVIGPHGRDRQTLAMAATFESAFGRPPLPAGFD